MASKKKTTTKKSSSRNASASKSLKKKTKSVAKPVATAKKTVSKKKTAAGKKAGSTKKKATTRTSAASKKTSGKKPASKKGSTRSKKTASRKRPRRPAPAVREEPPKRRLSTFADAVKIYEAAVRLMHKEKYDEAQSEFRRMVAEYPNETELFDRANVLIQVCDKRLKAQAVKPRLKGANDYYNVGVAQLNGGALDDALEHLEQALKLLPKAEHVLYALGALSALRGESKNALDYLSKSIDERNENRFLAANDDDFASVAEDPEFIRLVSSNGA